jgi:putative transferase (TIGR04331 family)
MPIFSKSIDSCTLVLTDIYTDTMRAQKTYFLGAWCFSSRHDERRARNAGRIISYHWDDRDKLKRNFDQLEIINEELLEEVLVALNQLHGVNGDKKFWRLLLGYWLNNYTAVVFDRWASIQEARKLGLTWQIAAPPFNDDALMVTDTEAFIKMATESSLWNHLLFILIAKYFPTIKQIPVDIPLSVFKSVKICQPSQKSAKLFIRNVVSRILNFLKSNDRFFLISTYLPRKKIAKLEIALGQIPLPRLSISCVTNPSYDLNRRNWKLPASGVKDEFSLIVRELLPKLLPCIFLEDFKNIMAQADVLPWSKTPDVIFTSNRHFLDDTFKAWAAQRIASGARLVVGEHGGMGVGLFNGCHRYELSVADTYLSTGWSDVKNKNVKPIGFFRNKIEKSTPKQTGKALLVCGNMPRFSSDIRAMVLSSQVLNYFEDQFSFVDLLPRYIREEILIRLYPADYGWEQKERWLDRHPAILFDDGNQSILKTASKYRLIISTYNATNYIETLVSNFPTVMFWNPAHWEVKPEAQPFFDQLKIAGIFHESAASAAHHISCIWDDISGWWGNNKVQGARQNFCDRYAKTPSDIDTRLEQILLEEACHSTIRGAR